MKTKPMLHFTDQTLEDLDKVKRLNIVNAVSGIKSANLIGSVSKKGETNLAIFSSVVHIGSNPPLIGFILRPSTEVRRHTHENILETGYYTINHVVERIVEKAHFTSAKFDKTQSEFDNCKIEPYFIQGFEAPFVSHSRIKMGLKFCTETPIALNGTSLIIGEIKHLLIDQDVINEEGYVDFEKSGSIGVGGLNQYYTLKKIADLPYARTTNLPDFSI